MENRVEILCPIDRWGNGKSDKLNGSVETSFSTTLHISLQALKKETATHTSSSLRRRRANGINGGVTLGHVSVTGDMA